ncbi:hypothetical protein CDD82_6838 [Ophiocordyceps australis]|uniref:Myb-like domain-containing protein n=1 Tax=Ophiocordyceps australis TaxID=1399860 RepID=A0A2C5YVK9_9HYPO|nr:hypothetical protein CDD82_6838 [Ophiocordyceps australis]
MNDESPRPSLEARQDAPESMDTGEHEDASTSPRLTRSSRKRAKPTYFEQPPEVETFTAENQGLEGLASSPELTPKSRKRSRTSGSKSNRDKKRGRQSIAQSADGNLVDDIEGQSTQTPRRSHRDGFIHGRFSDQELSHISNTVISFRNEHGMTQEEVNDMIQAPGGTTAGDAHAQLWSRIFAVCPDRHRQKVINITRKKFHNFVARGTWTQEQDAELSDLIAIHGPKWSKIAGLINRHPEDLRDRYRNYLVCGTNQRKDAWDEMEEARLTQFVIEAMASIDDLRQSEPDREILRRSYEDLIDWQNISERMNRTRSRLQCITKWKSLNLRTHGKDRLVSREPNSQISFRLEKARRQIQAMPDEERLRLLLAIHATSVGKDSKIPWTRLIDKHFRNQWQRSTQILLWQRLKQTVPEWETRTTRDCAQYLVEQYNQTGTLPDLRAEGYDDALEMELLKSKAASSTRSSGACVSKEHANTKSAAIVENSDDDDDDKNAPHSNAGEMGLDAISQAVSENLPDILAETIAEPDNMVERAVETIQDAAQQTMAQMMPVEMHDDDLKVDPALT